MLSSLFLALRVLNDILGNAALRCDKRQREMSRRGGKRVKKGKGKVRGKYRGGGRGETNINFKPTMRKN